ncbi:GINS complex, Sld5 component [Coccomyxa subellipsoidea C-169]|uniref:DNA replication complex GINS protein SLD5 n=1 Tax=Coccomyxa subellipsoidea (strain C-169) TaxID=574566 RepID=I0YKZ8_COCSC|nr:GINS complex, Sld5 component [Coccomyxa subellipsoidea C-169]EIE19067.1 GINS complex, Sld5 component [Coccomyxa subellipsoidea C-169]|eukprot:XP_005643611.1 GINS complex, Sld5 component [Coccomyxa subellipsoidea C-169]
MDDFISQLQTPAENVYGESDLILMKKAYINEKAAPELLDYQTDLLARLQDQVQNQEDRVANTDSTHAEGSLVRAIWRLELARARHLLRAYLRTRLHKLERHVTAVLDDPAMQARLSPLELQYAKDYFVKTGLHLKDAVLSHLPEEFNSLVRQSNVSEGHDMLSAPNLDAHAFVRVLEDRGAVNLDPEGDDVVELNKDDLYIIRYQPIRYLLKDNWVELV